MCGICLAINTDPRVALNELIDINLSSKEGFKLLSESVKESGILSSSAEEITKKSISDRDQHSLIDMMESQNKQQLNELALIKHDMWDNKSELKIHIKSHGFDPQLNSLILEYANEWQPYSGITFTQSNLKFADIIIELNGNFTHSSLIGKQAEPVSKQGL